MKPLSIPVFIACLLALAAHPAPAAPDKNAKPSKALGDIDAFITRLKYSPEKLLSTLDSGTVVNFPDKSTTPNKSIILCKSRVVTDNRPLEAITLLSPTTGVVYPGALVVADRNLAEGKPTVISLPQGPVQVSVDLPFMGSKGTVQVQDPTYGNVQSAIQDLQLAWLGGRRGQDTGQAARQSLLAQKAFSSQQIALALGFNAKWDTGNTLKINSEMSQNATSSSCFLLFRQVYFTASVQPPKRPSAVFADGVTLEDLKDVAGLSAERPPAYIQSVDYGRIVMVRMDTQSAESSADLTMAMKFAVAGGQSVDAETKLKYEKIIKNSTFTAITLGGNAEEATTILGSPDKVEARLYDLIKKCSIFSEKNPAVPISYKVNFLKDNTLATMNVTTKYTDWDCKEYPEGFVKLSHKGGYVARFEVHYDYTDAKGKKQLHEDYSSGNKTAGWKETVKLPGDATNIQIQAFYKTGIAWDPEREVLNVKLPGPSNKTYELTGTVANAGFDTKD